MKRFAAWIFLTIPIFSWAAFPVLEDFSKAQRLSKEHNMPLMLLFTGSDWDNQSQTVLKKYLVNEGLQDVLGSSVIFVKIDFPEHKLQDMAIKEINKDLRHKYEISSFPMFVLVDSDDREISRMGLASESTAVQFACMIKEQLFDYKMLQYAVENRGLAEYNFEEIKDLYVKASSMQCSHFLEPLLDEGLAKDTGVFFPMEKYVNFFNIGRVNDTEALELRQVIIKRDSQNNSGTLLRLALLDVQDPNKKPEQAVESLVNYVDDFGNKDLDNLWRLELIIADFFTQMGKPEKAIEHAEHSLKEAPEGTKSQIRTMLKSLTEPQAND